MRRSVALATVIAAALSIALGAVAFAAAAPIPGTLGLRLTPAPVHLDDGDRTITALNLSGGLPLTVTLAVTPSTYAVEPATFTLPVDASQLVTITTVDPSADGVLSATATSDVAGTVRSAIALTTQLRHRTFMERVLGAISDASRTPVAIIVALLLLLAALLSVRLEWRRHR